MEVGRERYELINRRVKETDALDYAVGIGDQDGRARDRAPAIQALPFQARSQLETMLRGEFNPVVHGARRIKESANSGNALDRASRDRRLERRPCNKGLGKLSKCRR